MPAICHGQFHRAVNVALNESWAPGTPCVSGPNSGAMGVYFVLSDRLMDGVLNADAPESLIHEPLPGGAFRLVGVEFICRLKGTERLTIGGTLPTRC